MIERMLSHPEALDWYRAVGRQLLPKPPTDRAVLSICGLAPEQGATTTAVGVATALATMRKEDVLLVECDFTRPGLAERLRVPGRPGLIGLLDGAARAEDVSRPTSLPNLTCIPAGWPERGAGFARDQAAAALDVLAEPGRAAVLVLDVPPVLTDRSARAWCELATHVLLVVRAGFQSGASLKRGVDLLRDCSLAGVVLNRQGSAIPPWATRLAELFMRMDE
ncbi:MAG: hypothetical protein HY331_10625 [Chloroflexi bacterium]|nr:hypothetical protein [Chloroflexota bacterium]